MAIQFPLKFTIKGTATVIRKADKECKKEPKK